MDRQKQTKKEQKIQDVMDIIEGLKDNSLHTIKPNKPITPIKKAPKDLHQVCSLFFSDVIARAEVIFKEGSECSTVDGRFAIITGNFNQNHTNTDDLLLYQLLGSDNAFTFEASALTSSTPLNISYQYQSGLVVAFISGAGELATAMNTYHNVPFTFTVQKTPNRCHFMFTINPLTNEAPIIMGENEFSSCDRVLIEKK